MRIILLIILSILLTGCAMHKKVIDEKEVPEQITQVKELYAVEDYELEELLYSEELQIVESAYAYADGTDYATQEPLIIKEIENRTSSSTNKGGHVVYKIPNEMTVRSTYQVIVRISKSTVHIYENLNGEVSTTTIPITQTMEVKLIDSSPSDHKMFDVVENNNGVQLVEDNEEYTQWTWDITPLRSGTTKLKIVISIIKNSIAKETVYEDEVVVRADVTKSVPFFIASYWQWIMSSLILPFGIWFYTKRKKKKKEEE